MLLLAGSFNWFWSSDDDSFDRQSYTNWAKGEPNNWRGDVYHQKNTLLGAYVGMGGKVPLPP